MKPDLLPSAATAALADDLRLALRHLVRRIRRDGEEDGSGLTLQRKQILHAISQQPGIGVAELARMENVRGPTMSGHIKALESAGLLQRAEPDPADRRRAGLLLTEQGIALLEALKGRRRDWLAGSLARLPPEGVDAIRHAIGYLNEIGK